jgi:hypothetical protein
LENIHNNCIDILNKKHITDDKIFAEARALKFSYRHFVLTNGLQEIKTEVVKAFTNFLRKNAIDDDIPIDDKLEGNIMISELGTMDLRQYVLYNRDMHKIISNYDWFKIFENVLNGIRDLQKHNILHNDLHMGNVLMLNKNESGTLITTWLIHDFGKSKILEEWSPCTRKQDVLQFISEFESTSCKTPEMETFVRNLKVMATTIIANDDSYMDKIIHYFTQEKIKPPFIGGFNKKIRKVKKKKTKTVKTKTVKTKTVKTKTVKKNGKNKKNK